MRKEKIEEILNCIRELSIPGKSPDELSLALLFSNLILLCLDTADDIDRAKLPPSEAMLWGEISRELCQLAALAIELQISAEDSRSAENRLQQIRASAKRIRVLLDIPDGLPEAAEKNASPLSVPDTAPASDVLSSPVKGKEALIPALEEDRLSRLAAEVRILREELAALLLEKDRLTLVEDRRLRAKYASELGPLAAELYRAEYELEYLKSKLRILRAALNRQEHISDSEVEEKLKEKVRRVTFNYEEFVRIINEARQEQSSGGDEDETGQGKSSPEYLKKLYRRIVKLLHPDMHPEQTPEQAALFRKANAAYEEGNVDMLEMILRTVQESEEEDPLAGRREKAEALLREKERLLTLIARLRQELADIRETFPHTVRDILDDPQKLEKRKEELRARLARARAAIEKNRLILKELQKKNEQ